jgi:hypothetical protein
MTVSSAKRSSGVQSPNAIINGAFDIWQRGTTFGSHTGIFYTADRWSTQATNGFVSRQVSGLPETEFALRIGRTAGQTTTSVRRVAQTLETASSVRFRNSQVTISAYIRAGANYSGSVTTIRLVSGTGTSQNLLSGLTGESVIISQNTTLTTSWQRFTFTGTVPANSNQLGVDFYYNGSGTAGADDWIEITGVQLELGSLPTSFRTHAPGIQGELAACQRYYYRSNAVGAFNNFANGLGKSTTIVAFSLKHPVSMRVVPFSVDFSNLAVFDGNTANTATVSVTLGGSLASNTEQSYIELNFASGITQFRPYILTNSPAGFIGFSAEL